MESDLLAEFNDNNPWSQLWSEKAQERDPEPVQLLQNLKETVELNGLQPSACSVAHLDWHTSLTPHFSPDRTFDVVIGSDLIYYEADAAALAATIVAHTAGVTSPRLRANRAREPGGSEGARGGGRRERVGTGHSAIARGRDTKRLTSMRFPAADGVAYLMCHRGRSGLQAMVRLLGAAVLALVFLCSWPLLFRPPPLFCSVCLSVCQCLFRAYLLCFCVESEDQIEEDASWRVLKCPITI